MVNRSFSRRRLEVQVCINYHSIRDNVFFYPHLQLQQYRLLKDQAFRLAAFHLPLLRFAALFSGFVLVRLLFALVSFFNIKGLRQHPFKKVIHIFKNSFKKSDTKQEKIYL